MIINKLARISMQLHRLSSLRYCFQSKLFFQGLLFSFYSLLIGCQVSESTRNYYGRVEKKPNIPPAPVEPKDLWEVMRKGMALNHTKEHPRIDKALLWYKKNPWHITQIIQYAKPYLHFIVTEAKARNLPLELALMPAVESAFDPHAFSPAGASGLWQIMKKTGEHMGLSQNWWYDDRRDLVLSTRAALNYMARLQDRFQSWELALAAYNYGPSRVSKAIKKYKTNDFWTLNLPAETTDYVPKLIALAKIINQPETYGFRLEAIPQTPYFDRVLIDKQIDIAVIAEQTKTPLAELYRLNPGLKRWSTPPNTQHPLLVPKYSSQKLISFLKTNPIQKPQQYRRYIVQRGDSLNEVAKNFNTEVKSIRSHNRLTSDLIYSGQLLIIAPPPETIVSNHNTLKLNTNPPFEKSTAIIKRKVQYIVKNGDSISYIANKFKVGIEDIHQWNNHIQNKKHLHPGQNLVLYVDLNGKNS